MRFSWIPAALCVLVLGGMPSTTAAQDYSEAQKARQERLKEREKARLEWEKERQKAELERLKYQQELEKERYKAELERLKHQQELERNQVRQGRFPQGRYGDSVYSRDGGLYDVDDDDSDDGSDDDSDDGDEVDDRYRISNPTPGRNRAILRNPRGSRTAGSFSIYDLNRDGVVSRADLLSAMRRAWR